MKRLLVAALALAACGKGVDPSALPTSQCTATASGSGAVAACGNVNVSNNAQSPSPTAPTVQDCRVDYLTGNGADFIPMNGEAHFDLTPMQTFLDAKGAQQTREVSAACNESRPVPEWSVGEARALQVTSLGFAAKVKRIGTGTTTVQVSFEGRSKVWQVQ